MLVSNHLNFEFIFQVRLLGPQGRTAHFHPNWSNGTAAVRGTQPINGGRFYWEINVSKRIFGTRYESRNLGNILNTNTVFFTEFLISFAF